MIIITKQQLEEDYVIDDYSIQNLKSLGFRKHHLLDSDSWSVYRFPVHKHKKITTLECELKIDLDNGAIRLDVFDMSNQPYPHFYTHPTGYNKKMLTSIFNKILKEYKKLGVVKKDETDY